VFTSSILIANFVAGQTMQTIIDNLAQHQFIEESNKKDVELIITRQGGDTSKVTILQSLMYVEMVNMVGRDHMSEIFD
jgi:predicted transcriptional regulator